MGRDRKLEWELLSDAQKTEIRESLQAKREEVASAMQELRGTLEQVFGPMGQAHGPQYEAIADSFKALDLKYAFANPLEAMAGKFADSMQLLNDALRQVWRPLVRLNTTVALYDAIKAGDEATASQILASEEFGLPLIKLLVHWTEMNEEERAKEKAEAGAEAIIKLERILKGPSQRTDAKDKAAFVKWAKEKPVTISNISELLDTGWDDWPLENSYGTDTLKAWYKEARPDVRLKGGRPSSKKRSTK